MAAVFIAEDIEIEQADLKFREEVYEQLWVIPNWNIIQRSKSLLAAQSFVVETGKSTGAQTKWKLGYKFGNSATDFHLYLKLIETIGFPNENVRALTNRWILKEGCPEDLLETSKKVVNLGQELEEPKIALCFNSERWVSESWLNSNGEATFKIKLAIMEPDLPSVLLRTDLFHNTSFAKTRANFADLLADQATSDLKIITSDGKEPFAHKIILKAQCPVFESMFRSDFSENKSGIVNVKDVSSKTMAIFLHLFYTGDLLPIWVDDDTVVEFTYAVGKYQLTNVLKLLDEVLGSRDEKDAFHIDLQLLDLARKLEMKTAEKEPLARIKKRLSKVNSGDEFFGLYHNHKE